MSVWDLGVDPLDYDANPWSHIASRTPSAFSRLISGSQLVGSALDIYLTTFQGWELFEITDIDAPIPSLDSVRAVTSQTDLNAASFVKETYVLSKRYAGDENIQVWDMSDGSLVESLEDESGLEANTWSSASTSNGDKHVFAGKSMTFVDASGSPGSPPTISARFASPSGNYRSIKMIQDGSDDLLFAFSNSNYLDVWNLNDIYTPSLESRTLIQAFVDKGGGAGYGIDVDPLSRRALLVSTNGLVTIVDIDELTLATEQPIYIPELTLSAGVAEVGSNMEVTFNLDRATSVETQVEYTTQDGTATAGVDYTASSGTLSFAPGETIKVISIPIDGAASVGTTFDIQSSQPGGLTQQNLVILDSNTQVTISSSP